MTSPFSIFRSDIDAIERLWPQMGTMSRTQRRLAKNSGEADEAQCVPRVLNITAWLRTGLYCPPDGRSLLPNSGSGRRPMPKP